jgi:hypothetical protein
MKWSTFSYNYRWSDYVVLFDGWVAKSAMAVPIVGYLILFNDSVSEHLSFNRLASENSFPHGLTSIARLKFIYLGLILLGSANILYRLRRPFVLTIGTSQFSYVEKALEHFTVSEYININGEISHYGPRTLYGKYYDADFDSFLDLALGTRRSKGERDESSANWASAKSKYEGLLRAILIENFSRHVVKRRVWLTFCILIASLGYLLLLVPSADLFIKVMSVIFR